MSFAPIVPNLPSTQAALTKKYSSTGPYGSGDILQALASLPNPTPWRPLPTPTMSNVVQPLALYDQRRANQGLMPLTARQSALALQTLRSQSPATQPRRQGFFTNVLSDMRATIGAIPKLLLPTSENLILKEIQALPTLPEELVKAQSSNPIQTIGNVASLPGFRLIPGSFIAQQLAADKAHGGMGVQGLIAHPLFTALDALPAVEGIAGTTQVARAVEEGYAKQVESITQSQVAKGLPPGTAGTLIPKPPQALRTALTRTLDESGAVVPNLLGRGAAALADDFKATNIGNSLNATFKEKLSSRIFNQQDQFIREAIDPNIRRESLQVPIPGGAAAIAPELDILDLGKDINARLKEHVGKPLSPEVRDFTERALYSETPDGTPLSPEQMPDWSPEQRQLARDIRDHAYLTADYTDALPGVQSTKSALIDGHREVFDYRSARNISTAQADAANATEIFEARRAALATTDTPRRGPDSPNGVLSHEEITTRLADVRSRLASEDRIPGGRKPLHHLEALYTKALEGTERPVIERVIPTLRSYTRDSITVPRLIDHLKSGRWVDARRELVNLAKTQPGHTLPFEIDDLKEELSRLTKRDAALKSTAHVDERFVERLKTRQSRIEDRYNPARFDPLVRRAASEATASRIREVFAHDPDLDTLLRLADEGLYDKLVTKDERFARWVREDQAAARASWKALRDAGHDPIFFTSVTPKQALRQQFPRVSDRPVTLQSVKARMWDATPYIKDAGIAVTQSGLDIINRRGAEAAMAEVVDHVGRPRADIMAEIEERLLAYPKDSAIPLRARAQEMFDRRYTEWNPGNLGQRGTGAFNVEGADRVYVPRAVAENIRRMYEPPLPKLTAAFDPILNVFRTSVLPLAVRWQLNNAVGGAIVTAVTDPRALAELPGVLKQMIDERRNGLPAAEDRIHIAGASPPGIGTMDPEFRRWQAENRHMSPLRERAEVVGGAARWGAGNKARDLFEAARSDRISKITDPVKRGLEMSYGANQFLDDMFRSMIGKSSVKRSLREGFTAEAADAVAVQSIRRAFQAWDEMTPMERSVMRSIFPFYGFAAWATKYVLRYPFDHPLRVSVLSSLARAEMTDAATGLPDYIREMILLGDPRTNGVVKALNVSPFNPLGGVPDMFTRAGFLGQMNPVIVSALQSLGVDTLSGGPQLYPELKYDPKTGRLVAEPGGNFISNLVGNTVPQAVGIWSLLGRNDEFNDTLKRDPGAAGRMLMGNFGLPVLFKNINVGDQLIRSEMARYDDQENARKTALKTGNLGVLGDFPGLSAYSQQLKTLAGTPQGQQLLQSLRPTAGEPGTSSDAGLAYALQAGLLANKAS